jgi:hypothetical protein
MACNHERIKSVNCVLFCDICGAELPPGFVPGKIKAEPVKAAETPAEAQGTQVKKTGRKKVK